MRKFVLEKGPFLRSADLPRHNMNNVMYDVVIALLPIFLFGCTVHSINASTLNIGFYYVLAPFINVICGCLFSVLFEGLYFYFFLNVKSFKGVLNKVVESYAVIPGLILSLILPAYTPVYVIIFGCFMANIVFKMLFGGLGHNIFNPALIAYAVCFASFSRIINDAISLQFNTQVAFLEASATPIKTISTMLSSGAMFNINVSSLPRVLLCVNAGSIAETSGLMCLVGFVYLLIKKVISWKIPVIYVGTVFVLTFILGLVKGNGFESIWFPVVSVLFGGLLFGAIFMATEPVTSPTTPNGKVLFALALGVFTVMIRFVIGIEGVATSILFLCLFTPIIDSFCAKLRTPVLNYKVVLKYLGFVLILAVCFLYTVYKVKTM